MRRLADRNQSGRIAWLGLLLGAGIGGACAQIIGIDPVVGEWDGGSDAGQGSSASSGGDPSAQSTSASSGGGAGGADCVLPISAAAGGDECHKACCKNEDCPSNCCKFRLCVLNGPMSGHGCTETDFCGDGCQNGDESGYDCGGPTCKTTRKCGDGKKCMVSEDCVTGDCDGGSCVGD